MTTENSSIDNSGYNIYTFISPCCNAFNVFENNVIICSKCEKIVKQLNDDEELTIAIHYNINDEDNQNHSNISSDLLNDQFKKANRYANDITAELVNKPCPMCKAEGKTTNLTRHLRNLNGENYFVCPDRHVFKN